QTCALPILGFYPGIAIVTGDDLVGNELLVLLDHRVVEAAADKALDCKKRVLRVGHGLALGRLANKALVGISKRNDGRRGARALGIFNDLCVLAVHNSDAGVGCSQIDANDFSPLFSPLSRLSGPLLAFPRTAPVRQIYHSWFSNIALTHGVPRI